MTTRALPLGMSLLLLGGGCNHPVTVPRPQWALSVWPRVVMRHQLRPIVARLTPLLPELGDCPEVRVEWGDGNAEARAWDCSDGEPAEPFSASHVYLAAGAYVVVVIITVAGQRRVFQSDVEVVG